MTRGKEGRKRGELPSSRPPSISISFLYLLQLREENLPLRRVGRHCYWVWASHLDTAAGEAGLGQEGGGLWLALSGGRRSREPRVCVCVRRGGVNPLDSDSHEGKGGEFHVGTGVAVAPAHRPRGPPVFLLPPTTRRLLLPNLGAAAAAAAPCRALWLSPCRKSRSALRLPGTRDCREGGKEEDEKPPGGWGNPPPGIVQFVEEVPSGRRMVFFSLSLLIATIGISPLPFPIILELCHVRSHVRLLSSKFQTVRCQPRVGCISLLPEF